MPYEDELPQSGDGQDPIRPKFGTKVVLKQADQDAELKTERKDLTPGDEAPPAEESPSGE